MQTTDQNPEDVVRHYINALERYRELPPGPEARILAAEAAYLMQNLQDGLSKSQLERLLKKHKSS